MDIIFFVILFAVIIAALQPGHSRTHHLPHAPFGADADVDHDLDRVVRDLLR